MAVRRASALLVLAVVPALAAARPDRPPTVGEPTCRVAPGSHPAARAVRWVPGPAEDRAELDRWCAGVGPPVVVEGPSSPSSADALTVVSWNTAVGAASLEDFVGDLRAGRLEGHVPAAPFVLLLQEVHGTGAPARPSAQARGAGRRIEPSGRDIATLARRLDLHLVYVPSGVEIPVHPEHPNAYNLLHEDDSIPQVTKLLEVPDVPATTLNWGGEVASIEEWCAYLGELTGLEPRFTETDEALGSNVLDLTRMHELIGPATTPWRDGIRRMVEARNPELLRG